MSRTVGLACDVFLMKQRITWCWQFPVFAHPSRPFTSLSSRTHNHALEYERRRRQQHEKRERRRQAKRGRYLVEDSPSP
jgi:hypothetical protein